MRFALICIAVSWAMLYVVVLVALDYLWLQPTRLIAAVKTVGSDPFQPARQIVWNPVTNKATKEN
jgi:hypothetical protein